MNLSPPTVFLASVLLTACGGPMIGTPCRTSYDCGGTGGATCEFRLPGGHCSRTCHSNLDCGQESVCIGPVGSGLCRSRCDAPGGQSSCRNGYLCVANEGDRGGHCAADPGASSGAGGGGGTTSSGVGGGGNAGGAGGGSAAGRCTGDATECSSLGSSFCNAEYGCYWNTASARCATLVFACSDIGASSQCSMRSGCRWSQ